MLGGEKTAPVGVATVEIDMVLATPELQELVEAAEQTGSLRHAELAEALEPLRLDALETDAVYRELEQRGIEVVEESQTRRPRPRSRSLRRRRPTRSSSSCARPAGIRC